MKLFVKDKYEKRLNVKTGLKTTRKGSTYLGSIGFNRSDATYYGKITNVHNLFTYEASSPEGLKKAFEEAVDDYIGLTEVAHED